MAEAGGVLHADLEPESIFRRLTTWRGELDRLPYGAIQLEIRGNILKYNAGGPLSRFAPRKHSRQEFFQAGRRHLHRCAAVLTVASRVRCHEKTERGISLPLRLQEPNPRDVIVTLHSSADTRHGLVARAPARQSAHQQGYVTITAFCPRSPQAFDPEACHSAER